MTFTAAVTKGDRVLISWDGRQVAALAGTDARRVIDRLAETEGSEEEQLVLARATGNFKRGNER